MHILFVSLFIILQQARRDAELLTSSLAAAVPQAALAAIAHSPRASPGNSVTRGTVRSLTSTPPGELAGGSSLQNTPSDISDSLKDRIYELENELSVLDAARAADALTAAAEADALVKRLQSAEEASKRAEKQVKREKSELHDALSEALHRIEDLETKLAATEALRDSLMTEAAITRTKYEKELESVRTAHRQIHVELATTKEFLAAEKEDNESLRLEVERLSLLQKQDEAEHDDDNEQDIQDFFGGRTHCIHSEDGDAATQVRDQNTAASGEVFDVFSGWSETGTETEPTFTASSAVKGPRRSEKTSFDTAFAHTRVSRLGLDSTTIRAVLPGRDGTVDIADQQTTLKMKFDGRDSNANTIKKPLMVIETKAFRSRHKKSQKHDTGSSSSRQRMPRSSILSFIGIAIMSIVGVTLTIGHKSQTTPPPPQMEKSIFIVNSTQSSVVDDENGDAISTNTD